MPLVFYTETLAPSPYFATRPKRLKELERESSSLKAIVADQALEVGALREVARGWMKVKLWRVCFLPVRRVASR
jgi:hypothetical protein